jgi:aspartate/methionine/tyrosine aminotransferase
MVKENAAERFMRATGKLRAIFGPANRSSLGHEMTEQNRRLLAMRQAETEQWETVHRPDGSTYVVPRNPEDKSLR